MITMESFLKAYRNGEPLRVNLDLFIQQYPTHELANVLKVLYHAYDHLELFDEAIKSTQKIDYKTYAIEEQMIFLQFLCQLYISADRLSSARAILATIYRLMTDELPIEWRVIPFELEGSLFRVEGYHRKHMHSLEKCLEALSPKSGKYKVILGIYLSQLCLINEQDKFETNLKIYKKILYGTPFEKRIDYLLALRFKETFHLEKMMEHIRKCREDKSLFFVESDLVVCEKMYQIFIKNNFTVINEENSGDWELASCAYILKNEPKKALYWAHKKLDIYPDYITQSYFNSYFYVRAALANGNTAAAEYTLENKKKFDNSCLYDDFFWFRIHHSKGNKKEAQNYFNLFSSHVEKYKLESRFDIELKLSPELSLTDIRNYTKNVMASEISKQPALIGKSTLDENSMHFIIGESHAIKQVKDLIKKYASLDTSTLILGETGTGKELVAKALWQAGPYNNKSFIPINCGAISDHLLQSELFGHQKGAFTGAFQNHKGVFEMAEEGIVFLDEIGEISPTMQISLLRVLEAREFRPVGSTEVKKLKCKIIAATNRNLTEQVANGSFRQDLQFRLERLTIEIPPLRNRPTDIPLLINHFLNNLHLTMAALVFDKSTLQHLSTLQWPGNIRELRNEMERVRLFYSDKKVLTIDELSDKYRSQVAIPPKSTKADLPILEKNLLNTKSRFRKLEELKIVFKNYQLLSRVEVAQLLNVSNNTAANYLNTLEKDNYIVRANPTDSGKAHYFKLADKTIE